MVKIKLEDSTESISPQLRRTQSEKPRRKSRSLGKNTSIKPLRSFAFASTMVKTMDSEPDPKHVSSQSLRSLVSTQSFKSTKPYDIDSDDDFDDLTVIEESRWKLRWKFVIAALVLISSFFVIKLDISSCGLRATYFNNYYKIVHNDERWCYRPLEPAPIVKELESQIIGQEDAIKLIRGSLSLANREIIIQMAFTGGTGVGKTLTSNVIMKHFKWQQNVISLIFNINFVSHLTGEEAFESDFMKVSTKLSDCGFNLVVIDDVPLGLKTVERIKTWEENLRRLAKQNVFKIVLVVVFNGNTETSVLRDELTNFVIVEFQPITQETFDKCIEIHQRLLNIKLKPNDIEELKHINFTNHGCKTLAKKLNLMTSVP